MKEALFYEKMKDKSVNCNLCHQHCNIKEGKYGLCLARVNNNGILYSEVYGKISSTNVDPIEKKPLYHFYPGSLAFSIGTCGCNFKCKFCQNSEISQIKTSSCKNIISMTPEEAVEGALSYGCKSIAYTYNEPTVNYEFCLETAKLAKKKKLKNVFVTNGYIEKKPLKEISKYLDAANIDLKSSSRKFYNEVCGADLDKALETIKEYKKLGIYIELTTMIVPEENDSKKDITGVCKWVIDNLGLETPMHFSRFYPCHLMKDKPITPLKSVEKAVRIARELGIKYVYGGNVSGTDLNDTFCPKCKSLIIKRTGYEISIKNLKKGYCGKCGEKLLLYY